MGIESRKRFGKLSHDIANTFHRMENSHNDVHVLGCDITVKITVRSASKITSPLDSTGAEAPKAPELRDLRIQQKLANTAEAHDSEQKPQQRAEAS